MATSQEITGLYQELLGRTPDAGGLAHYMRGSVATARNSISGSSERQRYLASRTAPPAPSANPLQDFAAQERARSDTLLAAQNKRQEGLFSNYRTTIGNQEALPAIYNRLQTEAGLPGLSQDAKVYKDQIYATKDKLDRLNEDVIARTTGYNVSSAQRRRLEAAEGEVLQTNLGRLGTALAPITEAISSAQSNVSNQLGLYASERDRQLRPLEMEINSLSDRFARELTGFNADRELQLTAVLDKLTRDRQLSDRDWELAQTLAAEERAFSRQKSLATSQLSNFSAGSTPSSSPPPARPTKPAVNYGSYIQSGTTPGLTPVGGGFPAGLTAGVPRSTTSVPNLSARPTYNNPFLRR